MKSSQYLFTIRYVISGFRREVADNCTLLGYYAASSVVPICPETSVENYQYSLHNKRSERSSIRLRVLESMVMRKVFRPKKGEETPRQWRTLHNEELYDLYSSQISLR